MIPHESRSQRIEDQTVEIPVLQRREAIAEMLHTIPQERIQRTVKQIGDVPMSRQFKKQIKEVDNVIPRGDHRTVELIVSLLMPEVVAVLAELDQITSRSPQQFSRRVSVICGLKDRGATLVAHLKIIAATVWA